MSFAPIILFVYNRADHALKTLEALSKNTLADQSTLYIFADGPKSGASPDDLDRIKETRAVLRQQKWCATVNIIESDTNKGLAKSIIQGVTETVNKYGKVIVLEDDIVTSKGFLKFMNDALTFYGNTEEVMHISGYMFPHQSELPETFFFNVPLCWGWATWKRAWNHFVEDIDILMDFACQGNWDEINRFGGDFLGRQLKKNKAGLLKTWFIKWHVSLLMKQGYTLYPTQSLVQNIGFDDSGENNNSSTEFLHNILAQEINVSNIPFEENLLAKNSIIKFYQKANKYVRQEPSFKTKLHHYFRKSTINLLCKILPEFKEVFRSNHPKSNKTDSVVGNHVKLYEPFKMTDVIVGDYTYIGQQSHLSHVVIGKFCSIGPNLRAGFGIHPINGISTSPMFYSTRAQNGMTLSKEDKLIERKTIVIGHDVFIGMNVTILDGVTIGDGAVIGAGAVVSKDIPPYAVAVGSPIKIKSYRFTEKVVKELLNTKWWDLKEENLGVIEENFWNIERCISEAKNKKC